MGTNAFPDGLVYSLFVPTKMVDFKPEGQAEYIVKVTGLKFEGALFTLSNRGVWDLKDTRTRLPWGGFSLLVDPVAHEAYRAAWRDAMASVLETASFPCWHIGYKLSDRKDDTFKGVGLSVSKRDDLMLAFEGGALKESVFRPSQAVKPGPSK